MPRPDKARRPDRAKRTPLKTFEVRFTIDKGSRPNLDQMERAFGVATVRAANPAAAEAFVRNKGIGSPLSREINSVRQV